MHVNIDFQYWSNPIFENQDARYYGLHGGRGSGKSHFFADLLLFKCVQSKIHAVCVREIQNSLEESVKKLLEEKIIKHNLSGFFNPLNNKITAKNGSKIIFRGMKDSRSSAGIKSLEGYNIAWVEEAQNISNESLTILKPTIRAKNSQIWFSWNPQHETDPIDVFLRKEKPDDAVVLEINYEQNKYFYNTSMPSEMEYDKARDYDKYLHVWRGQYLKLSEAKVFKHWKIEAFEAPNNAKFLFGADWGYSVDPSVLVRCYIIGRTIYIDYEVYKIGCEVIDLPELFSAVPLAKKSRIVADSARPETISHLKNNGFSRIVGAKKGKNSVEEGISWLKSYDIIVHPRCKHTIDELTHYSYKTHHLTGEILPELQDKNNHVIDSLRYACEDARKLNIYENL